MVHQGRQFGAHQIGYPRPLLGSVLGNGEGNERRFDGPTTVASIGQGIAHEVGAAVCWQLAHSGLATAAWMTSWASKMTSITLRMPRRVNLRMMPVEKGSAFKGAKLMTMTSPQPSLLTPTATITATEMTRPVWRTFT